MQSNKTNSNALPPIVLTASWRSTSSIVGETLSSRASVIKEAKDQLKSHAPKKQRPDSAPVSRLTPLLHTPQISITNEKHVVNNSDTSTSQLPNTEVLKQRNTVLSAPNIIDSVDAKQSSIQGAIQQKLSINNRRESSKNRPRIKVNKRPDCRFKTYSSEGDNKCVGLNRLGG